MGVRQTLIAELKSVLIEKGFWEENENVLDNVFKVSRDFLDNLQYVKSDTQIVCMIEKLKNIAYQSARGALADFARSGLLQIEPTVINAGVPSLVIGWGKYLHLFRGYYFHISSTQYGVSEIYAGADRLDFARRSLYYLCSDEERIGESADKFVTVACLIPVLLHFDSGKQLLNSGKDLLNDFILFTGGLDKLEDTKLDDFMRNVSHSKSNTKPAFPADFDGYSSDSVAIRLLSDDIGYGLLVIGKETISVTVYTKSDNYETFKLKIPEWLFMKDDDDEYYVSSHELFMRIMVRALMTLAGFRADYLCMRPVGVNCGDLQRIDYNIPGAASSWYDVEAYIKSFISSINEQVTNGMAEKISNNLLRQNQEVYEHLKDSEN